jgi:hypothetical protein
VIRYTPNLLRDEWINIGVLVFNPLTGERRLRLIETEGEFRRLLRLHPRADTEALRELQAHLEDRLTAPVPSTNGFNNNVNNGGNGWLRTLEKWENTLSTTLQLAPVKGSITTDLDVETDRLYANCVAVRTRPFKVGAPSTRAQLRSYCSQVFRQARLWDRIEKSVRVEKWTAPGDPMRMDYSYRRNGTLGFVQTLSVSRSPNDVKPLVYTAQRIHETERMKTEFAVVTDVPLVRGNKRDDFVGAVLRERDIEPIPVDGFAVWVAKLKPLLQ